MFDIINNCILGEHKNSAPRPGLYCVWIRAHEGEKSPLIQVWIDPSMFMFDSQARAHETDLAGACAEAEEAAVQDGDS